MFTGNPNTPTMRWVVEKELAWEPASLKSTRQQQEQEGLCLHKVSGEIQFSKVVPCPPHAHCNTRALARTHTYIDNNNNNKEVTCPLLIAVQWERATGSTYDQHKPYACVKNAIKKSIIYN